MMKATGHSTFDEWSNSSPTERAARWGKGSSRERLGAWCNRRR
jgi:hypothetical protein